MTAPEQVLEEDTVALGPSDVEVVDAGSPPPPPPDSLQGQAFGRYQLLGRFASGGMADIYLAREGAAADAERYLVVKCIRPAVAEQEQFLRMFRREARLALQLKHPNISHIYEFGRQKGRYFLAMEWVEGATLLELVKRAAGDQRHLPTPVVVKVIADVAEALDYAHRARDRHGRRLGVVHRDVSPQNVAIAFNGTVKLLDFGVAKVHAEGTQTRAGVVAGKYGYMSPEQCRDESLDGRCDVFSLGVVLFEALTGHRLYKRGTEYETLRAIIEDPVPTVRDHRPDLPNVLDDIVRRALAKRPADRFPTAGEMALALQRYLADRGELVTSGHVARVMGTYFAEEIRQGLPTLETDTELMRSLDRETSAARDAEQGSTSQAVERSPGWVEEAPIVRSLEPTDVLDGPAERSRSRRRRILHTQSLPVQATRFVLSRPWQAMGVVVAVLLGLTGVAFAGGVLIAGAGAPDAPAPVAPAPPDRRALPAGPPASHGPAPAPAAQPAPSANATADGQPAADDGASVDPPAPPTLRIEAHPSDARLFIDGERVGGSSPWTVEDVDPGVHRVTLRREGYQVYRGEVRVPQTGEVTFSRELTREERATVSIDTHPWSKVYVGDRLVGTTPLRGVRLPPGAVDLKLVDRNGDVHQKRVRLLPGAHRRLDYDLTR